MLRYLSMLHGAVKPGDEWWVDFTLRVLGVSRSECGYIPGIGFGYTACYVKRLLGLIHPWPRIWLYSLLCETKPYIMY